MADQWMSTADHAAAAAPAPTPADSGWMSTIDHAPPPPKPKPQSAWDRAVEAFGEFTSPLQPEPGQTFEGKAGQLIQGLADIPRQSGESLHRFGAAISKGDLPGAAYHLAGVVPILGPMSQTVAQDLDKGDVAGAVGHAGAILVSAGMAHPEALPTEATGEAVSKAARGTADVVRGPVGQAVKAGARAGTPDVLKGGARIAGGALASELIPDLPMPPGTRGMVGGLIGAYKGIPQIAGGLKKGMAAAKEAYGAAKQAAADEAAAAAEQAAAPAESEAYYGQQAGGRNAPEPTSEEYYASQPGGQAAEVQPAPEQQAAAEAQAARDAHEADFRNQATESLSGGAVKKYSKLKDPRAVSVVDRLTSEEMARYDQQGQPAAALPAEAPAAQPAAALAPVITAEPPQIETGAPAIPSTIHDLLKQQRAAKAQSPAVSGPVPAEAAQPSAPGGAPSFFNPGSIQRLIDIHEGGLQRPGGMPTFQDISEAMQTKARATRAENAQKWADFLESKGKTPEEVAQMDNREKWRLAGADPELLNTLPKSQAAVDKLGAAVVQEMNARQAVRTIPAPPPLQPSWLNPSALQRLIDLQEKGMVTRPR